MRIRQTGGAWPTFFRPRGRATGAAAGRELGDVRHPSGSLVVSDEEGGHVARPDTTLEPGKRYVGDVGPDVADEVMNLLRGS